MSYASMVAAIAALRSYIRDTADANNLLGEQESTDPELQQALEFSIDDFNESGYPTVYTVTDHPSERLLVRGAVLELLTSAGIIMSRNRLNYNDAGLAIAISDKASEYSSWIQMIYVDYEKGKLHNKLRTNVSQGWSS